jgi:small-conductance mechanosensitive channel
MQTGTHDIPELDARGLRSFGITTGAIFIALFALLFPWLFDAAMPLWPWVLGGVLGLWAGVHPASLRPVYRGWMKFGLLLSKITTPLILGLLFYVFVTPMGFVLRLFRDPMRRAIDPAQSTYRVQPDTDQPHSMENPF